MTQDRIIAGNKIIAPFAGFKTNRGKSAWKYSYDDNSFFSLLPKSIHCNILTENLKFHSSWNWLMTVWKKIIDLTNNLSPYLNAYFKAHYINDITNGLYICDIEATWLAIVQFIKWYNKTKS